MGKNILANTFSSQKPVSVKFCACLPRSQLPHSSAGTYVECDENGALMRSFLCLTSDYYIDSQY